MATREIDAKVSGNMLGAVVVSCAVVFLLSFAGFLGGLSAITLVEALLR